MTWYNTGTVTTAASTAVVGAGTAWIANAASGMGIRLGGAIYEVASVNSDTSITLATNYNGTTGAGQSYSLMPTQDYIRSLAAQVASLISTYSTIATNAGAGKFGDGTVASPGITFGSNTNTGFYKYAANAIGIATNGVFAAVVDASGNVGIGTNTPTSKLDVAGNISLNTGALVGFAASSQSATISGATAPYYGMGIAATHTGFGGAGTSLGGYYGLMLHTSGAERMRIDSAGNTFVGTAAQPNPSLSASKLVIAGKITAGSSNTVAGQTLLQGSYGSGTTVTLGTEYSSGGMILGYGAAPSTASANSFISTYAGSLGRSAITIADTIKFFAGTAQSAAIDSTLTMPEVARIDSAGNFGIGGTPGAKFDIIGNSTAYLSRVQNTHASAPAGLWVNYSASSPNNTTSEFLICADTTTTRVAIRSNGGLANFSANNVNLSDARTKKDIKPAPSYYKRWQALQFRTFLYRDQTDTERNLGVIAQEIEAVCPELVDVSGFGETPADGVPMKAIYQTDFQYATAVALQEAIAIIEELRTRVAALEALS